MLTGLQFMYTLRTVTQTYSKAFLSLSIRHRTHRKDGNVILFTPQEKYGLLCVCSYETHKCQQCYTRIFHTQFRANRRKCVESKGRDALNPQKKVWLSLRPYSRNSKLTQQILWTFPLRNIIQKEEMIWKIGAKFYLPS